MVAPHLALDDIRAAFPELKVEREYKRGGFKTVFDALSPQGSRVALKIMAVGGKADAERVQREVAAMQQITHPNLTVCEEAGTREVAGIHTAYIVEPFAEGD